MKTNLNESEEPVTKEDSKNSKSHLYDLIDIEEKHLDWFIISAMVLLLFFVVFGIIL